MNVPHKITAASVLFLALAVHTPPALAESALAAAHEPLRAMLHTSRVECRRGAAGACATGRGLERRTLAAYALRRACDRGSANACLGVVLSVPRLGRSFIMSSETVVVGSETIFPDAATAASPVSN